MSTEIRMPRLTSSMLEGTISQWLKREGDTVSQGEPLLVVESDKSTTEVESPASGTLLRLLHQAGETVDVDGVIAMVGVAGEEPVGSPSPAEGPSTPAARPGLVASTGARQHRVQASPVAKRLAAEKGIDLSRVVGTGPRGLVVESDILAYVEQAIARPAAPVQAYGTVSDVPLTPIQRAMSDRMLASRQHVVQGTTFAEVDMTVAMEARKRLGASVTAIMAAAAVRALLEHPVMNSSVGEGTLRMHGYVNLGVAAATERGLVVPVIHNAERLDARGLSEAIDAVSAKARQTALSPRDVADATFTITNSGALGALAFVPIVSYPENAILGMGKVMPTPVVREREIVVRDMVHLAVSYNHRVIDGASAVTFLQRVKALLENPAPG